MLRSATSWNLKASSLWLGSWSNIIQALGLAEWFTKSMPGATAAVPQKAFPSWKHRVLTVEIAQAISSQVYSLWAGSNTMAEHMSLQVCSTSNFKALIWHGQRDA